MFPATGPGNILGNPNLKKKYLSKFFAAKMKKTFVIMPQKLLYKLCIFKRKNRKFRLNLLLALRATFSKIWAP